MAYSLNVPNDPNGWVFGSTASGVSYIVIGNEQKYKKDKSFLKDAEKEKLINTLKRLL